MKKLLISLLVMMMALLCVTSCVSDDETHQHSYVSGKCSCGATDPNYKAPHVHNYEGGKCSCGAEDPYIVIPCTHTPSEAIRENVVDATCTATGSYEEVIKCSLCGEELSRTAKVIEKLDHTPAEATRENVVNATCTATGSYEEVIKCSLCGVELSREDKIIEKAAHTPAAATKENEIPATCTSAGSYEEVIKCVDCDVEISRVTKGELMLEHKYSRGECSVCGAADPFYTANHTHNFVDGICTGCGLTDPKFEPDYGSATVFAPGSEVVLITNEYTEALNNMVRELDDMLDYNGNGGVVNGSIYFPNSRYEILFNVTDEDDSRPLIGKARQLLERVERDSYFEARYVIYADSGTLAVAFDDNEYTNLQATDYVVEVLNKYITGKGYVALPEGIVATGIINLKTLQEEIDIEYTKNQWIQFENAAKRKYGEATGKRIVDAFRTYYSMIDDRVVSWWAYMYDPGIGGFYGTSSGRDHLGYLPNIEGTDQILGHLNSSGMLDTLGGNVTENLPRLMVHQLVYYFKSLQNPSNGYFYNPQLGISGTTTYRLGRDQGRCTSRLVALGSRPTYTHPNGTVGDGITADEYWDMMVAAGEISPDEPRPYVPTSLEDYENYLNNKNVTGNLGEDTAVVVSKVVLTASEDASEFVSSFEKFDEWLKKYGDSIDKNPYSGVSNINATYKTIEAAANKIGKSTDESKWYYGMDFKEMVIKVLNDHINDKGLFGTYDKNSTDPSAGCKYANTNGLMKGIPIYTAWGIAYPKPLEAVQGCLIGIMSDEKSTGNICETYNIWEALQGVLSNVSKYGTVEQQRELLGYTDEFGVYHMGTVEKALGEFGPEAVINTYNKQKNYQTSEGGFSHNVSKGGTENGGLPIGLGLKENNVDANGFGMQSVINAMANCFGIRNVRPALFTESDWMTFIDIVLDLQPVIKYSYDEMNGTSAIDKVFTFDEDLPQTGVSVTNNANFPTNTHKWSGAVGKDGDKGVLRVDKAADGSGSSMNVVTNANVKATGATMVTFEVDIRYSNIQQKSESQIQLGTLSKTSMRDMPIFILLTFDGTADGSKIRYSDYTNGKTNGQNIDTGAVVGEWFTLKIEYYSGDINTFRFRTYINDKLIYTSNAIYSQKIYASADVLPSAADIQRSSWSFNEKFKGTFEFDNISLIQSRGTLEGDVGVGEPGKEEMPDEVPDGPPESIPDIIPEGITTPAASDAVKFDTIPADTVTKITSADFLNVYYVVDDITGNKVLYVDKRSYMDSNSGVIFRQYPTTKEENATIAIFEADYYLSGYEQLEVIQFTAHTGNSTSPYMMVLKAVGKEKGAKVQFNNYHWDTANNKSVGQKWIDTPAKVGEWFRVRIEYEVTDVAASGSVTGIKYRMYVNNQLIKEDTAIYGSSLSANGGNTAVPTVDMLNNFNFSFNASTKGRFAVDNFSFRKLAVNDRVEGELVIPDPTIGSGFDAPEGAITFRESFEDMIAEGKIKVETLESEGNTFSVVTERGDKMLNLVKTDSTKEEKFLHKATAEAGTYDYVSYEAVLKYAPAEGQTGSDVELALLDASGERVLYTLLNFGGADGALQIQAYKRTAAGIVESGFKSPKAPVKAGEFFKVRIEYILGLVEDCTKIYINDELLISGDYYSGTKADGEGYTDTLYTAIDSAAVIGSTEFVGTMFIDYSLLETRQTPEKEISFDKEWEDKITPITNASFAALNTWKVESVDGNNVLVVSKQGVDNSGTSWNGGLSFVVKPTQVENNATIAILEFDIYFSSFSGGSNNQITMGHQGTRTNQSSPMLYSIPSDEWKSGKVQHVVFFYEVLEVDSSNIPTKIRYGYSIDSGAFTIYDTPYAKATSLKVNGGSYELPRVDQVDSFTFALNNSFKGEGWIDNVRMALLQSYEIPEAPVEPPHTHNYVDGKCSCGATDPNYKPDTPDTPDTPEKPQYPNGFDFEDGTIPEGLAVATNVAFAELNTWTVVDAHGSKMLFINKDGKDTSGTSWNGGVTLRLAPTKIEADATIAVLSFDIYMENMSGFDSQITMAHQGKNSNAVYPFLLSLPKQYNEMLHIVITYEVTEYDSEGAPSAMKYTMSVNGVTTIETSEIYENATSLKDGSVKLPTMEQINSITIALNNSFLGDAYLDNIKFELLKELHEHSFVDGKCECGAADPDYKPEEKYGFDFEDGQLPSGVVITVHKDFAEANTYQIVDVDGNKKLFINKTVKDESSASNGGVSIKVGVTKQEDDAKIAVFSFDAIFTKLSGTANQVNINHQGYTGNKYSPFIQSIPNLAVNVQYHMVITYEVTATDEAGVPTAAKLVIYVNGKAVSTTTDIHTAAVNLVPNGGSVNLPTVSQINSFTFALNNAFIGEAYLDNIKVELLSEFSISEDAHEHKFVDGKCECGAEDPNYVAPKYNEVLSFDEIPSNISYKPTLNNLAITPDPKGGDNNVLVVDPTFSAETKSFEYTVSNINEDAEVVVFETDVLISSDAGVTFEIFLLTKSSHSSRDKNPVFVYFASYDANIFENGKGSGSVTSGLVRGEWCNIRIEFRVKSVGGVNVPETKVYVNGNLVDVSSNLYGTSYYNEDGSLNNALVPALSNIDGARINVSNSITSGKYYFDNLLLHHLKEEDIEVPPVPDNTIDFENGEIPKDLAISTYSEFIGEGLNDWKVVDVDGNKMLFVDKNVKDTESGKYLGGVSFKYGPTKVEGNAQIAVVSFNVRFENITGFDTQITLQHQGKSGKEITPFLLQLPRRYDENLEVVIIYQPTAFDENGVPTAMKYTMSINGEVITESTEIYEKATSLIGGSVKLPVVTQIDSITIAVNNSFLGDAYFDNFKLELLEELPHEHEFVEGECECGEKDPDYVPPHEHEYVDGVCTECGEKDPSVISFDEMPATSLLVISSGNAQERPYIQGENTWEIVTVEGSENKVLHISKGANGKLVGVPNNAGTPDDPSDDYTEDKDSTNWGVSVKSYVTKAEENANVAVFEAKYLFKNLSGNSGIQFRLYGKSTTAANAPVMLYFATGGNPVDGAAFTYCDYYNGKGNTTGADYGKKVGAVVGTWYTLRIEYRVTETGEDGTPTAIEYRTYVDGNLVAVSSSVYGANIVAGTSALPKVSEISMMNFAFNNAYLGDFYIDDLSFKLIYEEPHEHSFVEGICTSCGEADPDYVPHVHEYVKGECACGDTDGTFSNYNEMPDVKVTKIACAGNTNAGLVGINTWEIVTVDENKVLYINKQADGTVVQINDNGTPDDTSDDYEETVPNKFTNCNVTVSQFVTSKVENANVMIFEADVMYKSVKYADVIQINIGVTASSPILGVFRPASTADGAVIKNSSSGTNACETSAKVGEWFHIRIEYRVTATDEAGEPTAIEAKYFINDDAPIVSKEIYKKAIKISNIEVLHFAFNNRNLGEYYVDNTSLRLEYEEPHVHTSAEAVRENEVAATCTAEGSYDEVVKCSGCGEVLSRETKVLAKLDHSYSEGACTSCGAADPDYVAPECEHNYVDGVCTKCEAKDPEYVAPDGGEVDPEEPVVCEHEFVDGVCTKCGESDPDYVAPDEGEVDPEEPVACEHEFFDGVCTKCGELDPDYVAADEGNEELEESAG